MNEPYDFDIMFRYSLGRRAETDTETIRQMIAGCVSVRPTETAMDKQGVDYIARLRGGAELLIDAKTRRPGCRRYWRGEPDLALEKWSVRPGGKFNTQRNYAKTGWSLDETKNVDYILFTFHPSDSTVVYLFAYQLLRMAFVENIVTWYNEYKVDIQQSVSGNTRWESEAVFVPASVVFSAVNKVSQGKLRTPKCQE